MDHNSFQLSAVLLAQKYFAPPAAFVIIAFMAAVLFLGVLHESRFTLKTHAL
jgi:hypothetical protein